ncbi:MAG: VCBS repeat-containing protein [Syntrophotaleaceae bacterium]
MFLKRLTLLATCVLLLTAGPVLAGPLEEMAADLQPVSGYVVLPVQDEFLIDLDASKGVAVGDLFAVVQPGEKIVHPVTGAVLGTLDVRKGLLQVTQVKTGYSQARLVAAAGEIVRGDQIRRFENLRAAFWDYTGKGEAFFAQVKEALPALNWQDYATSQASRPAQPEAPAAAGLDLLLVLDNNKLTVRDGSFGILHAYPAPAGMQPAVSAPLQPAAPYKLEAAPQVLTVSGVRYEATFPGFKSLGALGFTAVMADFLEVDGQWLLAATDGKTIKLLEVGEAATPLAEVMPSDLAQVLSLHWWQPSSDQVCLAVSGWKDNKLSSSLYLFADGRLTLIDEYLPYLFGSFDRNGDGQRELLLTQSFDREMVWGTLIKEGHLVGRNFTVQDLSFELPRRFTVAGSMMADLTGDGKTETVFVRGGLLYIYAGTKQLYRSPKMMGGTLSRFLFEKDPNARETETNYAAFEVPPVAADLDGDGQLELLTVASDSSLLSTPGIGAGVKKSWLAVIKKRENMFVKGTLGEELEVPLQGLAVAGDRVLFIATEPGSVFGEGGGSQLLVFPLAR